MFQNKNSASVKANSLFEGLDKSFRINISQKDFLEKKEGEIIYQNGDNADYIYLLLEGEVKQKISGVFTSPVIVKSSQNEFFGEKEVLENTKRSSSAVANTDCLLYRLDKAAINTLAGQDKTIKRNLYKSLLMDEPDETAPAEPQKKFFINAEDSTKKFKIPEEKTPGNRERAEITEEDLAEIEKPETENNSEAPAVPVEEPPLSEEPPADEIPAENYINFDKELTEDNMKPQSDEEFFNPADEITQGQQEIPEQQDWNFSREEELLQNVSDESAAEDMPATDKPEDITGDIEKTLIEEPEITWQEAQPPAEENISAETPVTSRVTEPVQGEIPVPEKKSGSGKEAAGLISNDLLYPVSTVKFYAEQIKKRGISPELNEVVDLLLEQANIIQDLADVVYDFTEDRSSLNIVPASLNEVLDEILGLLADFIESRSSRLYKKYESNTTVELDKRKFYQAMFQIAKITCNTIPAGGNIYVVSSSEGNYVRIFISTASLLRGEKSSGGEFSPLLTSGLGYLIAERIIKDHGGSILIEKTEEGSKLIISLPLLQ